MTWGGGGARTHQVCRCHQTGGGTPINTLKGWAALQRDLARTEEGAARDLMIFSRDKCEVLLWGRRNPWDGLAGGSSAEKCLGCHKQHAGRDPAACPSSNEGRQHPGLC